VAFDQGQVQFHRLLDKLPAGAYICDQDGLITYFNQHAARRLAAWNRLSAWFPRAIDGDRRSGRRAQLHAMLLAPEVVGDVPEIRPGAAGNAGATLDVLGVDLPTAAACIRADRGPGDRAASRGYVLTASAADLVSENAADDRADDRSWNVGAAGPIVDDLLALDPAPLLGRADNGMH
jgi:hypothetical protein